MRSAVIALALCSVAQAATFTATQAGNWADAATWGGSGPPGAGDRAIIQCCVVTIPASTSVTIGDSPVAGTAVITIAPSSSVTNPVLVNAGTLTLQGDMVVGPNFAVGHPSGTYSMSAGSVTQFSSPAATVYRMTWPVQNNGLPYPLIRSTATSWASPAIIQTMPGNVGNNGQIFTAGADSALNLAYTKLINLGSSSVLAVRVGGDLIFNHVLMLGSGGLQHDGAAFGYQNCIDYLDIRTPTASQPINWVVLSPTGCNHLNNSVILAGAINTTLNLQAAGLLISNTIFGVASPRFSASSNVTMKNVLLADLFGSITPNGFDGVPINSGFFWDGGAFWANETSFNTHVMSDSSGTGINVPNAVQNLVIDGSGATPGLGDLWVEPGVHYVNLAVMVNGAGNLEDGTGTSATSFGFINHSSSENADGGSGASTVNLNEFRVNLNQLKQATNILADRNYNGLCIASDAAPYVQQSGLNYDYNWLSNRKDPDPINAVSVRPWNSATNHQGTLCDNWVSGSGVGGANLSKATITVSTVTDASHLIVSSTAFVNVGDYLYHNASARGAFVLAVPSSGHVTIGFDEDGVLGIPSAVAGQSLVILPNPWSAGIFGDAGKGQHEGYSDARMIDPNVSVETWDKANGGPGTRANARTEAYKVNGWDVNGNAATFNPAYSITSYLAYVRHGLIPTSLLLKGFANDASWAALTAFVVGQSVLDTARHLQICTTAGTSGGSTPAWNDIGGTTSDGTVIWTDQGSGIDPGAIPISIYNSPGITGGGVN